VHTEFVGKVEEGGGGIGTEDLSVENMAILRVYISGRWLE
jgi:hypothetical protein